MSPAAPAFARSIPWTEWTLALKNLFFPIFCKHCGLRLLTEENGFFCPGCWHDSPRIEQPFCVHCGRPLDQVLTWGVWRPSLCPDCTGQKLPRVDRVWGATVYDGAVAEAIKLLKFSGKQRLSGPLGLLMEEFARREMDPAAYDLIVPVPLHRVRLRERGFNQSLLLARAIQPAFAGVPIDESLQRIRPTRTQSALHRDERLHSLRGAFAVTGEACRDKRVLLIDDVVTTGGTICECARALKRAGAVSVEVFAAALAVRQHPAS